METWLVIAMFGGLGGFLNALLADGGLKGWKKDVIDGTTIWRLGWVGNVIIGGAGGWLNWALNGSTPGTAAGAAALLVGIGGSRAITSQLDKQAGDASRRLTQEGFQGAIDQLKAQIQKLQEPPSEENK